MKKVLFIFLSCTCLVSCKKEEATISQNGNIQTWPGIYKSTDLIDDSTGIVQSQTNINIVSENPDSIMLSAVVQSFGASYFNDVLAHIDTNYNVVVLGAHITGANATLNTRNWEWTLGGHQNDLLSADFTLNPDNSITLKYSKLEHGSESGHPTHSGVVKSYTGHFYK